MFDVNRVKICCGSAHSNLSLFVAGMFGTQVTRLEFGL